MKSALKPSAPVLCVRDLCARFGDFALENISLEVWANERVGIVGKSGSGKSLLAKLLMGLVAGSDIRGSITLQGIEANLAACPISSPLWRTIRAKGIAYIPQSPKLALNPLHSIAKQLGEMCALHLPHTPKSHYNAIIDDALESVGLESSLKHRLPHTLSGGQAQRVCIAMMILARPKILLCDEPTTALDAHIQSQILELLASFTEMAIVLISHDLGLMGRFAERGYVMERGKICGHFGRDSSSAILESKSDLGDCALNSHSADFGDFMVTADSCSAIKSPKNSKSPTANLKILEEDKQAECEKSAENKKVDSSKQAYFLSLRALRSKAWQSTQTKTQSLESTFSHNAKKSQKVDSSNDYFAAAKIMDSKETSANAERYPLFCHAAATTAARNDDKNTDTQKVDSRDNAQNVENSAQDSRIFTQNAPILTTPQAEGFCDDFLKKLRFGGFQGGGEGILLGVNEQAPAAESPKSAQKANADTQKVCLRLHNFGAYHTTKGFFTKQKIPAVQGINLALKMGDSVGIIGASGSGKSSLALGILGLEGQLGELCLYPIESKDPLIYTDKRRDRAFISMVQIVFQDPLAALNPRMCVLEIVQEALQSQNAKKSSPLQAMQILEQVGLSRAFAYRYSATLSGGEAQRVCIARALASGARILLLDEPTSALDKSTQQDIITLLLDLQQRLNLSYLVISHDLSVIEAMCDCVLVLESGQVIEQGELAQVFSAPSHPYTQALLRARI
ncbi:ATP-binding cassette domain-containing protein [Helicobacter canis]|uniref:Oligopeptide ABC transporter ATP-binding protein n=1 Tax=Helicobacter canis TaxID=29419 RepID=A0A377J2H9_9HELI|nr:ATP-binding cassette domain-containing protein [Helicobacter canis]STO96578.1 oligopeptide ABC transporter ATP-binding protein [Helicobacter canis]